MRCRADGGTAVFVSRKPLLDADTSPYVGAENFDQFAHNKDPYRLYKWQEGQLSFIGIRPDGSVPESGSILGLEGSSKRYTVSRDGSRVVFGAGRDDSVSQTDLRGHTLYIQTDGQPTVNAEKEEGVPPIARLAVLGRELPRRRGRRLAHLLHHRHAADPRLGRAKTGRKPKKASATKTSTPSTWEPARCAT